MTDAEFQDLVERARGGDGEAVESLLGVFESDVRAMVRGRLPRLLRTRFDSMDFVQEVWQSLFARSLDEGDGPGFDDPAHFRRYVAGVVRNKVLGEYRRQTRCQKNDLSREEPLYVDRGGRAEPRPVVAPNPTPSEEMHARDCFDRIVAGRDPLEARILEMRQQLMTYEEIAERTGIHERTVRRMVEAMRDRWPVQGPER